MTVEYDIPSVTLRREGIGGESVCECKGGVLSDTKVLEMAPQLLNKQGAISHPGVAGCVSHVHMPRAHRNVAKHSRWEVVGRGEVLQGGAYWNDGLSCLSHPPPPQMIPSAWA